MPGAESLPRSPAALRRLGAGLVRTLGSFLGLGIVVVLFATLAGDLAWTPAPPFVRLVDRSFLGFDNFKTVATQTAIIGTAGVGMTLVVVGGGIDLSVGALVALCAVTVALVFRGEFYPRLVATVFRDSTFAAWSTAAGLTAWAAIQLARRSEGRVAGAGFVAATWAMGYFVLGGSGAAAAVAASLTVGALAGFVNGYVITTTAVVPFIVTLGAMEAFRGLAQLLAGGQAINVDDALIGQCPWLRDLMTPDMPPAWIARLPGLSDSAFALSRGVYLMAFAGIAVAALLRATTLGRGIFAVGSNEKAARLSGLPVARIQWAMYSLAGLLAGLAAVMSFARLKQADSTAGLGLELRAIAAVVIGGGSLRGGEGTILGTFIGAFTMAFMDSGCVLAGIPNAVQKILVGSIIVLAVALDEWRHRRAR